MIKIKYLVVSLLLLTIGCTSKFEEYNTNPNQIHKADPSTLLKPMIETVVNIQQNSSQMIDQMVGTLGGYFTLSNRWGNTNFDTFNPSDDWNASPWNSPFQNIYGNFFQVKEATNGNGHFYALARLVRAITMLRVVDLYGPMPYSKVEKGNFYVTYDSQESVYNNILEDCKNAADVLFDYNVTTSGNKPLGDNDPIYFGDYSKWAKLANSMRLRVAIRISGAFPQLAKEHAEEAVSHKAGIIASNDDNAMLDCGSQNNPYQLAAFSWDDLRVNASIVDFMKGYNDPRLYKYFSNSTFSGHTNEIIGMRSGTANFAKSEVTSYSQPAIDARDKLLVFCAAETSFLKAEGDLLGWNMGGTAETFYKNGIALSMDQYNVPSDSYINNNTLTPSGHLNDPRGKKLDITATTDITIAWEESATNDRKLERIITQKWIANYPLGLESWAEFRRTGFPKLFPCIDNLSQVITNKTRGMRRLRFPYTEVQNNSTNYTEGVILLNGADNEATDLVWAKKK